MLVSFKEPPRSVVFWVLHRNIENTKFERTSGIIRSNLQSCIRGGSDDIRKHLIAKRAIKHYNRLPREAVDPMSVSVLKEAFGQCT